MLFRMTFFLFFIFQTASCVEPGVIEQAIKRSPAETFHYPGRLAKLLSERPAFKELIDAVTADDFTRVVRAYENAHEIERKNALSIAIEHGASERIINYLIDHSDLATLSSFRSAELVPLISAVKLENREIIDKLLSKNVDVNVYDTQGLTPLLYAVANGDVATATKLLNAGADPNLLPDVGNKELVKSPLINAIITGHTELVRLLLKHGADANVRHSGTLMTPLHFVVEYSSGIPKENQAEFVKMLLNASADINARSLKGRTSLIAAAQQGNAFIEKIFRQHGADATIRDDAGMNASNYLEQRRKRIEQKDPSNQCQSQLTWKSAAATVALSALALYLWSKWEDYRYAKKAKARKKKKEQEASETERKKRKQAAGAAERTAHSQD